MSRLMPDREPRCAIVEEMSRLDWRQTPEPDFYPEIFTFGQRRTKVSNRLFWTMLIVLGLAIAYLLFS